MERTEEIIIATDEYFSKDLENGKEIKVVMLAMKVSLVNLTGKR